MIYSRNPLVLDHRLSANDVLQYFPSHSVSIGFNIYEIPRQKKNKYSFNLTLTLFKENKITGKTGVQNKYTRVTLNRAFFTLTQNIRYKCQYSFGFLCKVTSLIIYM